MSASAQTEGPIQPSTGHPIDPGAPFFPASSRAEPVLERAELMTSLDSLEAARTVLEQRADTAATIDTVSYTQLTLPTNREV